MPGLFDFSGLLVMTVGLKKLSCRTVVAIGGVLYVLAHIISGFAQDIRVFYFSHGLLGGKVYISCICFLMYEIKCSGVIYD